MKITNPEYNLPIIEALAALDQFENSANKPLLISGVNTKNGERGEFVVKLNGSERMRFPVPRCKELVAAFIAMELGISVVEPVIINVSNEFAKNTFGKSFFQTVNSSIGYNVGSKYLSKTSVLAAEQKLSARQMDHASLIFVFDIVIQNIDRTTQIGGKPNLLTDGDHLVLLDHELAFSFLETLPFLQNKTPWQFNSEDKAWINKHILFKYINHQEVNYSEILEKLTTLDAHFWEQVSNLVPEGWKSDTIDQIKVYIDSIIQNRNLLSISLNHLH